MQASVAVSLSYIRAIVLFIEILNFYFQSSSKFSFRYCCIIVIFLKRIYSLYCIGKCLPLITYHPKNKKQTKKNLLCLLSAAPLTLALSAPWGLCSASMCCESYPDGWSCMLSVKFMLWTVCLCSLKISLLKC